MRLNCMYSYSISKKKRDSSVLLSCMSWWCYYSRLFRKHDSVYVVKSIYLVRHRYTVMVLCRVAGAGRQSEGKSDRKMSAGGRTWRRAQSRCWAVTWASCSARSAPYNKPRIDVCIRRKCRHPNDRCSPNCPSCAAFPDANGRRQYLHRRRRRLRHQNRQLRRGRRCHCLRRCGCARRRQQSAVGSVCNIREGTALTDSWSQARRTCRWDSSRHVRAFEVGRRSSAGRWRRRRAHPDSGAAARIRKSS